MPAPRAIFPLALLGLLGGCSLFQSDDTPRAPGGERLQGDLRWNGDQLLFRPCQEQRFFDVTDANNTAILRDAHELAADSGAASLFADLRGKLKSGGRVAPRACSPSPTSTACSTAVRAAAIPTSSVPP